jgi:hypothetical protein
MSGGHGIRRGAIAPALVTATDGVDLIAKLDGEPR